jgi:hypothetical protein
MTAEDAMRSFERRRVANGGKSVMRFARLQKIFAVVATAGLISLGSAAQDAPPPDAGMPPPPDAVAPPPGQPAPALTQAQLDQLVAPVALYDDSLLTDILTASTYPLEVVEAHRWLADPVNAGLKGSDLANALANQDWDPSVKALVPFPDILANLDSHLDWTEHLGEAFLAQQGDVMDAVQRLRLRAQQAGTLKSSPQETVADTGGDVTISPPPSQIIYVPSYDPWCAYGAWPYPAGQYYYSPWVGTCGPDDYGIAWDAGLYLPFDYWDWGYFDWRDHRIDINRDRYNHFHPDRVPSGNVWTHDPDHRVGVPYRDPRNAQQFHAMQSFGQSFRGYDSTRGGGTTGFEHVSPAFESFGSGSDVRMQSQRGFASRGGGGISHGFAGGGHVGGGHGR